MSLIIKKNWSGQRIMAIVLLCAMVISSLAPAMSRASEDDFPLPETFIDEIFPAQGSIEGTDGTLGDDGTEGTTPEMPGDNGDSGEDGDDSPASYYVEDMLNGSSTPSGEAGTDGNNASTTENTSNTQGSSGASGNNMVRGRAANVYIKTGDASAYASIINYLNTTVIGSRDIDIINIYGPTLGTLDFSDFNPHAVASTSSASGLQSYGAGNSTPSFLDTELTAQNNALLSNDLTLNASSGFNRAVGANGNVIVETGDVEVDASIFNMVNTNLIGRDWKFKVINIFSDVVGDLILPALDTERSAAGCSGCLNSLNITNESYIVNNNASVGNQIQVNANTGNNSASGFGGSGTIRTGNSNAQASVYNLVDTTIIGDNWYYSQFRVAGDWRGSVYNTGSAADLLLSGNDFSVRNEGRETDRTTSQYDRDLLALAGGSQNVLTNNTANVLNTITINADSGSNTASGAYGDAIIRTGDITAKSAITNVVNTTIIGDGWQFYLVNIFGNWKGSAHYGMPDLAVSEVAVPDATPVRRGNTITYVYSYTNGGDAVATDVVLRDRFDADKVHVTDTSGGTVRGNTITWRIGRLNPRETRVLSYTTTVNAPDGSLPIQNEVTITGSNGDRDMSNNSTGGQVSMALASSGGGSQGNSGGYSPGSYYSGASGNSVSNPAFNLVKASDRDTYSAGETIPFTIILDNFRPSSGYAVGVVDQFYSPSNEVVLTEVWDLGEVVGFEHIEISYSIPIPARAIPGPYINKVTIYSKNSQGDILPAVVINLPITITERKKLQEPIPVLDILPSEFLFDLTFEDDVSSTTPTTTDFTLLGGTVTRSKGSKNDTPAVHGYSVSSSTNEFEDTNIAGVARVKPSGFMDRVQVNLAIWAFLMLLGMLALLIYRYLKKLISRIPSGARKIRRLLGIRGATTAFVILSLATAQVVHIIEPLIKRLPENLKSLVVGTAVAKKKNSHDRIIVDSNGILRIKR